MFNWAQLGSYLIQNDILIQVERNEKKILIGKMNNDDWSTNLQIIIAGMTTERWQNDTDWRSHRLLIDDLSLYSSMIEDHQQ